MNVLYLVHRIPYPPDKGDKIRSYRWLEHLQAQGHRVHLVTLRDDPDDARHEEAVAELCASCTVVPLSTRRRRLVSVLRIPDRRPLSLNYFHLRAAQDAVDAVLQREEIDVVLAFSGPMARYVEGVPDVPVVMDMVDVDSAKFADYARLGTWPARSLYALEADRLSAYEARLVDELDAVVLCTEPEAGLLRERCSGGRIEVIGNGVVLPDVEVRPVVSVPRMVFVGAMDYYANVDAVEFAAREILPRVRAEVPDAEFHIVGRNPTDAVEALDRLDGVVVHGATPEVGPHLLEARLSLVPLRIAQGIQNKVLEAMAFRLPVVTSGKVAASLIGGDEALCAADEPEDYARHCVRLLRDDDLAARLGAAGRRLVGERYQWSAFGDRLVALLRDVRDRRTAGVG